jgi:hypothetical protein
LSAHTTLVTTTGRTTATVIGTVDPAGRPTYYKAVYDLASSKWCSSNGTSGNPANATAQQLLRYLPNVQVLPITDFYFHGVVVNLAGLTGGSRYCVAISATNSSGTSTGPPIQFTAGAPAARSYGVTSTSPTTATLFGAVNPAGQTTTYRVLYDLQNSTWCSSNGTSGIPTYSTGPQTLAYTDGTLHDVWVAWAGMVSGTSYCATITATNASATASAAVGSFTQDVPAVVNNDVAVAGATSATINGEINAFGQPSTEYGDIYDLASSAWCASNGSTPDATTAHEGGISFPYTDSVFHSVSVGWPRLTALTPNTEYCATLEASNSSGGITQAVPIYFTTAAS